MTTRTDTTGNTAEKQAFLIEHHALDVLQGASLTAECERFMAAPYAIQKRIIDVMAESDVIFPDVAVISVDHAQDASGFRVDGALLAVEVKRLFGPYYDLAAKLISPEGVDLQARLADYLASSGEPSPDVFLDALGHKLAQPLNDQDREIMAGQLKEIRDDIFTFQTTNLSNRYLNNELSRLAYLYVDRRVQFDPLSRQLDAPAQQIELLEENVRIVRAVSHDVSRVQGALSAIMDLPVKSDVDWINNLHDTFIERADLPQPDALRAMQQELSTVEKTLLHVMEQRRKGNAAGVDLSASVGLLAEPIRNSLVNMQTLPALIDKVITVVKRDGHPLKDGGELVLGREMKKMAQGLASAAAGMALRSTAFDQAVPALTDQVAEPEPRSAQRLASRPLR